MTHEVGHVGTDGHFVVCDVCGRGPSSKVWIMPHYVPGKPRSRSEMLQWARRAGRRIGLELKREMEQQP